MLTVTPAAGRYLNDVLDRNQAPAEAAVRILVMPEGLRTTIDQAHDDDTSFDHGGRKVLVLDAKASTALSERTLDVDAEGRHLVCTG